jgi:hypothetical protein
MKVIQDRMFQGETLRAPGVFENIRFEGCEFSFCKIGSTTYAGWRVHLRNIQIVNCSSLVMSRTGPVVAEDCLIDGLQTDDRITALEQPLLKHVTLRGRIGNFGISDKPIWPIICSLRSSAAGACPRSPRLPGILGTATNAINLSRKSNGINDI